jgi:hypothetical protein
MPILSPTAVHRQRLVSREMSKPAGAKSGSFAIKNWDPYFTSKNRPLREGGAAPNNLPHRLPAKQSENTIANYPHYQGARF